MASVKKKIVLVCSLGCCWAVDTLSAAMDAGLVLVQIGLAVLLCYIPYKLGEEAVESTIDRPYIYHSCAILCAMVLAFILCEPSGEIREHSPFGNGEVIDEVNVHLTEERKTRRFFIIFFVASGGSILGWHMGARTWHRKYSDAMNSILSGRKSQSQPIDTDEESDPDEPLPCEYTLLRPDMPTRKLNWTEVYELIRDRKLSKYDWIHHKDYPLGRMPMMYCPEFHRWFKDP
jgi:hypothetical protein